MRSSHNKAAALAAAAAAGAIVLGGPPGGVCPAQAGGFLIYDLSAEALAKGSAVTASTREPAAAWFNPAALAFIPGYGASAGAVMILPRSRFTPDGGEPAVESVPSTFFLPAIFAHAELAERVNAGIGVFTPFGLGIEWPDGWIGREAAIKASIQTVTTNPSLTLRVHDDLSVAVGFSAVRAVVDFTNGLPELVGGAARLGGATWGFGGNAALLYRAIPERIHLGFTYRSRVKLSFDDGRVDFDPNPEFASQLPDQRGSSKITLPDILTMGVMWRPTPALELTFDPNLVLWSTYDELKLDFETAPDKVMRRDNRNSFTLRAGADWSSPIEGLHVRGGFIFDQNPSPSETLSPSLPDANRVDFAAGVGFARGRFKVDAGYLFVYFLSSKATTGREGPEGTYDSVAHLIGLTLTVRSPL